MLKKYVCLVVFLFSLPVFSATESSKINSSQTPFLELENLFSKGDINFSFDVNKIKKVSWHAGRCFTRANRALASLLFFLPNDFYKGHLLASGAPRMWAFRHFGPVTFFDNIDLEKEKELSNVYATSPSLVPELTKLPNSLVSNRLYTHNSIEYHDQLVLRHYNNYLITSLRHPHGVVAFYCYYFKKVK